jgi:septal ring factor EnvC (AmiA/AmiB activator)
MEITLESIISFIGLFVGGGAGAFFTWRYQKKKAKAEAESAEIDAAKEMQSLYKQMLNDANEYLTDARDKVDGLRQERDRYKQDNEELRQKVDKLTKMFYELKTEGEKERSQLRVSISTLQSQLKGIIGLTCSVQDCKLRQVISFGDAKPRKRKSDVEPLDQNDL